MKREENDAFSRCHPLVGFMFFVGAIGLGAVILHPLYILASGLCAVSYYCLLKGGRGIKMVLISIPMFLLLTFANPLVNHDGERVLTYVFGRPYTLEALIYGMAIAGMLIVMLLWAGCYNAVMTSDKFMTLFGGMVPSLSMLLLMVLRLVPNMIRKIGQIAGARKSIGKGAGENASRREKAADSLNVLSALMTWALEGGVITADAMRSRGYNAGKRSCFLIHTMRAPDRLLLGIMAVLAAAVIALIGAGGTAAAYTPVMNITPVTGRHVWGFAAYCAFLSLPTVLYIKEAIQWRVSRSRI